MQLTLTYLGVHSQTVVISTLQLQPQLRRRRSAVCNSLQKNSKPAPSRACCAVVYCHVLLHACLLCVSGIEVTIVSMSAGDKGAHQRRLVP